MYTAAPKLSDILADPATVWISITVAECHDDKRCRGGTHFAEPDLSREFLLQPHQHAVGGAGGVHHGEA